jgi:LCP family protein required for cell wall assembly
MTLDNRVSSSRHSSYQKLSKSKSFSPLINGFIWGGTFTLTAIISGILGATIALKSSLPTNVNPLLATVQNLTKYGFRSLFISPLKEPINILIMGIDNVPGAEQDSDKRFSGRSDTILLARFQPQDHSLRLLSIPRDSRVEMPSGSYDKINSTNTKGGAEFTAQVLSQNLRNVTIHRYLRVTTNAFREMVDLVGGIEVYIPQDMRYVDLTQNLNINLKQGLQTLNGEEAEHFSRFRSDALGDIGRVQRQQLLLKALSEKMQNPSMIMRLPKIWELLENSIDTNLTSEEMVSLTSFAISLDQKSIKMVMLPGRFSSPTEYRLSYWLISEVGKDQVLEQFFDQDFSSLDSPVNSRRSPHRLKIAIQNGTSNPKLARAMAQYLEDHDFPNVYLSANFSLPTRKTQIIAQQGDLNSARMLQQVLEFGEVDASSIGDVDSDLTVLVGADAQKLLEEESFAR